MNRRPPILRTALRRVAGVALAVVCASGVLPGCGGDHDHDHDHAHGDHDHGTPKSGGSTAPATDEHSHDHALRVALGEAAAGPHTVVLSRDAVKPGAETGFDVSVKTPAGAPRVVAVRVWIGTEDAQGSLRAKADKEGEGWHAHVESPDPLPAGSRVWVELEEDGAGRPRVSFGTDPVR